MGFADFFEKSSSNVAKDRLKMVLVSDRANCSPDIMEQIKNDIIHVLSKYVDVDLDGLDRIKIEQIRNRKAPMVWCRHFLLIFRLKT
ncbi:MAG: cell division topological specificity factor MinE [Clostridium sp.]